MSDVRECCLHNGFFQILGHNVPLELQENIMNWNKKFFDLPLEEKVKVGKGMLSLSLSLRPPPRVSSRQLLMLVDHRHNQHLEPWV